MKLFVNGKPAAKGQEVKTFNGRRCLLTGWREPHKESSSGRVFIKGIGEGARSYSAEFFPSVIGGEFKKDVVKVTKDEAREIIKARERKGLFYCYEDGLYVGIDNESGDSWTEEFDTFEDCERWLYGYEGNEEFGNMGI